ncbi:MAG: right-handed parallel beta-helix repeat-containing protein [Phycisphaerales bacterium]|nr:MAG: right-handed parallel beta-helix repeat-containing protein [Phycisphaerales bacterium]
MRTTHLTAIVSLIALAAISAFYVTTSPAQDADMPAARLPGAKPVIDASRYPTLQAAIDALPDDGGAVRLPPGTFEISEPLRISTSDVLLEGAGTATHIKNVNAEGKSALILQHSSGAENRKAELWRVRLANFRITGNEKSGHGIEARRINEIFVEGVTVSYHGGDGIQLYYCYEDPRICDSLVTYNKKTGLNLIGCHDIVVSANQFEENQDAVRCFDGFNLCMTGNNLDDHLGNGVVIENTYGSVVSGNMIEECRGAAIVLDRDCYGIALSANVIAHNTAGGIQLRDAHGCAVSANTFTIMGVDALSIGPESGRITVTGNNFSDSYIGDDKLRRAENDRSAGGMSLNGTLDVTVVGNLFSGLRPKALAVKGKPSTRILFGGNVLADAVSEDDKLDASLVTDNLKPTGGK